MVYATIPKADADKTTMRSCSQDGLKKEEGLGTAVIWGNSSRSASLPREASIYSAEAHAISMAVRAVHEIEGEQFVVISDSGSVLRTLLDVKNDHPVCRNMIHNVHQLREANKTEELC